MSSIVDRRKVLGGSRRPARTSPSDSPPREPVDGNRPPARHDGSCVEHSTRFAVTSLDEHAGLLRVGIARDGVLALRQLVAAEPDQLDDLVHDALRHGPVHADKIDGMVLVVRPTPANEPARPAFAAGLLVFYEPANRRSSHEPRSSVVYVNESVHAAADLRLGTHIIALQFADAALANVGRTPPHPPPDMPQLIWRNSGTRQMTWVRARPSPLLLAGTRLESHEAYDLLDEADVSLHDRAPLCAALKAVLGLIEQHIGAAAHEVIARSRPGVVWEREVMTMRAQLKRDYEEGTELLVSSPFPGAHPLHFFGRLCWTWTGAEYAIFELVASGSYLIELHVLRTSSDDVVDFGRLCGLPIYTNTPPEKDSAPDERDERVRFRILGTVQGGSARTAFVSPFDYVFTSLRTALHAGGAGLALLTPVLPAVAPAAGLLHRAGRRVRSHVQNVRGRLDDPQGSFKQGIRDLGGATRGLAGALGSSSGASVVGGLFSQ